MSESTKHKTLIFFTDKYPLGRTQEAYIDNELNYLLARFNKIIFIPVDTSGTSRINIKNTEVLDIHKQVIVSKWNLVCHFRVIVSFLKLEAINKNSGGLIFNLKKIFNAINYSDAIKSYMIKNNLDESNTVLYSYWFYHWSLVCSVLKHDNHLLKVFSRAHLNDLYGEFNKDQFTGVKLHYLNAVFPISNHGSNYMYHQFPFYKSKIKTHYLGVNDLGINSIIFDKDKFIVLSCSAIRSEKRIDKIVETLKHIAFPITWIHFGDGPDLQLVKNACKELPSNVKVELKGFTQNHLVKEYYLKNQINLFLNFSSAEGLPVSILEVISFGIPVMATKIYGTPEAVPEHVGELIEKDFSPIEVAIKITNFKYSFKNTDEFRLRVRKFWEEKFNAKINYTNFTNEIIS